MKKILILGGDHFTIPVVEAAKKQGYYTITCDYLPDNVAHKYSDEYVNFSTTDKDGILQWAQENKIDGIVTFTDSGVVTTAYVQHHLRLPQVGPLESVEILQNKDRFRDFLRTNGFNTPWAYSFDSVDEALKYIDKFSYPLIVKPTDSAGSKGVTRVDREVDLKEAFLHALKFSVKGKIIVEEFLEKKGASSDSDSFSVNGIFKFISFSSQHFDDKALGCYTPAAYSWPSTMTKQEELDLSSELQRLISLLKMNTSVYNIETRVASNNKTYIMEVSPRGGGNRLSEMMKYATGVDLITAAVRAAVGDEVKGVTQKSYEGNWAEIILHADNDGIFKELKIDESVQECVYEVDLWVSDGDAVRGFSAANAAIGTLVLNCKTKEQMLDLIKNQVDWLNVVVE